MKMKARSPALYVERSHWEHPTSNTRSLARPGNGMQEALPPVCDRQLLPLFTSCILSDRPPWVKTPALPGSASRSRRTLRAPSAARAPQESRQVSRRQVG
ncbi:MAG: hypothetical protein GDA43_04580 [Hormoscilla sp. SP5CHS1]|nr:hypothetical protein [Hormoscilla sp. SP5CHS1]